MKKILILSFSQIKRDPRVMRQIHALQDDYQITVCGWGDAPELKLNFIAADDARPGFLGKVFCVLMLAFHFDVLFHWGFKRNRKTFRTLAQQPTYDLILSNDLDMLPIAAKLARKWSAKVIADLHEYFPGQSSGWMFDALFAGYNKRECARLMPLCYKCITVSEGIRQLYYQDIGVVCELIINAPNYVSQDPSPVRSDKIRLVHHGVANPDRKILELIKVVKLLDERFALDLVLVESGDREYMNEVREAVASVGDQVKILLPFAMQEIAERLNEYDLGVCMLEVRSLSKKFALPNKLFEWIQGRLGVVAWPLPDMKSVIEQNGIGVVSDAFTVESLAKTLNSLDAVQITEFKNNAHIAAKTLNAAASTQQIRDCVFETLAK